MTITNYYQHNSYIVAFDDRPYVHWIEVKDMYRYLIDNFLLDTSIDDKKFSITYDEWFNESDIAKIDIVSYLLSQELKKKIHNQINIITKNYNNESESNN